MAKSRKKNRLAGNTKTKSHIWACQKQNPQFGKTYGQTKLGPGNAATYRAEKNHTQHHFPRIFCFGDMDREDI